MLFEIPKQIMFWDIDGDHYVGGIGYGDVIICGCCGGTFEVNELYELTPKEIKPIMIFEDWVNINDGDALEDGEDDLVHLYYSDEELIRLAKDWDYFYKYAEVSI